MDTSTVIISEQIERGNLNLRIMRLFRALLCKGWSLGDDFTRDDSLLLGIKLSSSRIAYSLWQYLASTQTEGIPQKKPALPVLVDLLLTKLDREAYYEELSGENGASATLYQMVAEHFRMWPGFKSCFTDFVKMLEEEKMEPMPVPEDTPKGDSPAFDQQLSTSQQTAFDFCFDLGRLFFGGRRLDAGFGMRTFPLLVGPTGAGKSYLVRRLAKALNCHYLPLNYGSWLPQGCKKSPNTIDLIATTALKHNRVLLHLDELDKLRGNFSSGWDISISNELWDLLDQNLSGAHLDNQQFAPRDHDKVLNGIRRRVWIVGSGTWQSIFEDHTQTMGFAASRQRSQESVIDDIFQMRLVPSELLARFNSKVQVLSYPNDAELVSFLDSMNISLDESQSTQLRERIQRSGFRSVEDLVTEHCIGLLPPVTESWATKSRCSMKTTG